MKEKYVTAQVTTTKKGVRIDIWLPSSVLKESLSGIIEQVMTSLKLKEEEARELPQSRDPASTTSSSTERRWFPVNEAPASAFGFTKGSS